MPMSVEEYRIAQLYMIQVRFAASGSTTAKNGQRRVARVTVGAGQDRASRQWTRPPANVFRGHEGRCCPADQMALHMPADYILFNII